VVALRLRRAALYDVLEDHTDMGLQLLRGLAGGVSASLARLSRQSGG
jgi:hypothetical protein